MPHYHKYQDLYTPEEYLEARGEDGRYLDPEVRFYRRIKLLEIGGVMPNHMYDRDSCLFGFLIRWKNPFARLPRLLWKPLRRALNFIV
jgi:hypothetical protein